MTQNWFPFTDIGKRQERRDHGPYQAYAVRLGKKEVWVSAADPNDAKMTALPPLMSVFREQPPYVIEQACAYLELRVTRKPELDQYATSRGEIIV